MQMNIIASTKTWKQYVKTIAVISEWKKCVYIPDFPLFIFPKNF